MQEWWIHLQIMGSPMSVSSVEDRAVELVLLTRELPRTFEVEMAVDGSDAVPVLAADSKERDVLLTRNKLHVAYINWL